MTTESGYGYVKCVNCGEETVHIQTKATHKSTDYAMHWLNGYEAYNSDSSWTAKKGTEQFVCESCHRVWPVDGEINWIWNDR